MKNTDIKYKLSTDYNKLYDLLHSGIKVVGFCGITGFNHIVNFDYSRLIEMSYVPEHLEYKFSHITFWTDQISCIDDFIIVCKSGNIRFFEPDLNN